MSLIVNYFSPYTSKFFFQQNHLATRSVSWLKDFVRFESTSIYDINPVNQFKNMFIKISDPNKRKIEKCKEKILTSISPTIFQQGTKLIFLDIFLSSHIFLSSKTFINVSIIAIRMLSNIICDLSSCFKFKIIVKNLKFK